MRLHSSIVALLLACPSFVSALYIKPGSLSPTRRTASAPPTYEYTTPGVLRLHHPRPHRPLQLGETLRSWERPEEYPPRVPSPPPNTPVWDTPPKPPPKTPLPPLGSSHTISHAIRSRQLKFPPPPERLPLTLPPPPSGPPPHPPPPSFPPPLIPSEKQ